MPSHAASARRRTVVRDERLAVYREYLFVAILGCLLLTPAAAAIAPIGPPESSVTTSTPTFTWQLAPGEEASSIELSPNPAPGAFGGFTDDTRKRTAILADHRTSYAVGDSEPLSPGTWFWHVNAFTADFEPVWTPVRRVWVPDEPIRLVSFKVTSHQCLRRVGVEFKYEDNSVGQPPVYRLEFRRSRRGKRVASVAARAEDGQHFKSLRLPRRVRRGRFYVRLRVRDAGGHVALSGLRRIRVGRC
jgi:hypothetical protein